MARWGTVSRLGFPVVLALCVAVVSVSTSAPLIAYAAAPALALAFWRNALSLAVLGPAAATRGRAQFADLVARDRRTLGVCGLSGLALAVHFGTWVPSAKLTTVATATALVCTTPIWSAMIATAQGTRLPRVTWIGITIAVVGAVLATGADFAVSGSLTGGAVLGDVLALIGGVAGAVYFALGERARTVVSTTVYSSTVYSVCALALLVVCLATGTEMVDFPAMTWLAIVGTTVFPQLLGHTMVNYSLRRVSATTVNVLLLLEVPGATLLGWLLIDQLPDARSVPGLAILTVGVAVVMIGAARASRATAIEDAAQQPTL
ncbi:DMT family transporter [Virgisporangium aurantiacum]|uniref:DMT family transporter n=1 Tax=Virgisporangium aurantiacum TaxID=175570 RepID=UPI00195251D9|nr:DMT family transporter [Virgisporangium aurantiacum]